MTGSPSRGWMARTPLQQIELASRILENRHFNDVRIRAEKELGERGLTLGPLDLTRNTLSTYTGRLGTARRRPPLVSGLPAAIAHALGDASASTLIRKYRALGGGPLPTPVIVASTKAQRYELGASYAGVAINWGRRSKRASLSVISPADLRLTYGSDDPTEPTIIDHIRKRKIDNRWTMVADRYDLTDEDAPSLKVYKVGPLGEIDEDADVTSKALSPEDIERGWYWRDSEGRPWHRIVVTGDNLDPYQTNTLVEGTLKVSVLYTHHGAGIRDSCYSGQHVMDMEPVGMDSDEETGQIGTMAGPEIVQHWRSIHQDRPGQHWQNAPAYDPEVVGRAIRDYELGLLASYGLPVSFERTGGDPTEQDRRALDELVRGTYPTCRILDGRIIQRVGMLLNRIGDEDPKSRPYPEVDERPFGVLYREEIDEAAADAATTVAAKPTVSEPLPADPAAA